MTNLLFLDTETTGTDTAKDSIIECCFIETTPDFVEVKRLQTLVNPECPIPKESIEIHGITDEAVRDAPKFREVAQRIQAILAGKTLVGQNVVFDISILHRQLLECQLPGIPVSQPTADTLRVERYVNSHRLGPTFARYTGRELEGAHRSMADVEATIAVLQGQLRVHANRLPGGLASVIGRGMDVLDGEASLDYLDHSHKFYRDEQGVVRFAFGKHEGEEAAAKPDYLDWMVNKGNFPLDTVQVADRLRKPKVAFY